MDVALQHGTFRLIAPLSPTYLKCWEGINGIGYNVHSFHVYRGAATYRGAVNYRGAGAVTNHHCRSGWNDMHSAGSYGPDQIYALSHPRGYHGPHGK
jgi:hypothetical protein